MNGFILVKGEQHEGYEILGMYETEDAAWLAADDFPLTAECDYYDVIQISNGKVLQ